MKSKIAYCIAKYCNVCEEKLLSLRFRLIEKGQILFSYGFLSKTSKIAFCIAKFCNVCDKKNFQSEISFNN